MEGVDALAFGGEGEHEMHVGGCGRWWVLVGMDGGRIAWFEEKVEVLRVIAGWERWAV